MASYFSFQRICDNELTLAALGFFLLVSPGVFCNSSFSTPVVEPPVSVTISKSPHVPPPRTGTNPDSAAASFVSGMNVGDESLYFNEYLNCSNSIKIKGMGLPVSQAFDRIKLMPINFFHTQAPKFTMQAPKEGASSGEEQAVVAEPVNCSKPFNWDIASRPDKSIIIFSLSVLEKCQGNILEKLKDATEHHPERLNHDLYILVIKDRTGSTPEVAESLKILFGTQGLGGYVKGFLPAHQDGFLHEILSSAVKVTDVGDSSSSRLTPDASALLPSLSLTCDFGTLPNVDPQNTLATDSLLNNFSRTSVLFVSVSFIILMVISLAWLVFYYVQRFRYAHAKDRLARRLFNAAKKVLAKMPAKTLKHGDKEMESDCPVCIEPYHNGDVVRTLPCRHVFHKTCVDPWLLEHRTCPMCKMDILKAYGYNFGHSEESVRDADQLSAGGQSTDGVHSQGDFRPPLPTDSDLHDPFFPSPAPSPSMLQPVLHSNNTHTFSIIPLTVHNTHSALDRRSTGLPPVDEDFSTTRCWASADVHHRSTLAAPSADGELQGSSANDSSASSSGSEDAGVCHPLVGDSGSCVSSVPIMRRPTTVAVVAGRKGALAATTIMPVAATLTTSTLAPVAAGGTRNRRRRFAGASFEKNALHNDSQQRQRRPKRHGRHAVEEAIVVCGAAPSKPRSVSSQDLSHRHEVAADDDPNSGVTANGNANDSTSQHMVSDPVTPRDRLSTACYKMHAAPSLESL